MSLYSLIMVNMFYKCNFLKFLCISLLLLSDYKLKGQLIINEILASNLSYASDEYGEYDDIIEIFNPTQIEIDLSGYFLSDDINNLTKWAFPPHEDFFILPPDGYLKLWADNEPEQGINHLSFSLDSNGESVILTDTNGVTIIDQINFDDQIFNVSFGRDIQNNDSWVYFINPSLGAPNDAQGYDGILNPPLISMSTGYYDQPIYSSISNPNNVGEILYNLNEDFSSSNGYLYEEPIHINSNSVLNAKTMKDDFISSVINSNLFITEMSEPYTLPILAVLTNPNNLWDDSTGIYVNYLEEGVKWERRCMTQFFSEDSLSFSLASGVRIQGRSSRVRPKKSFRLFFRNAYDFDRLNYPLFEGNGPNSFKNIVLRSGYDDDLQMSRGTLIRDPLVSSIWAQLGGLTSRGIFSNLYINNQYWGIYNLRESINEHFISDHTGFIDFDLIRYLKDDFDLKHGSFNNWNLLNTYIKNTDFISTDNYQEILSKIDFENFLNLQALIICTGYWSWGWGVSAYKENSISSKWRWTIWDMDRAFTNLTWNGFTFLDDTTGLESPNIIVNRLLDNKDFQNNYINRISDFFNDIFKPENIIEKIDSIENIIEGDIQFEAEKWDGDTSDWRSNVAEIRYFAENRPEIVKQQLNDYFSLQGEGQIILESSEGGRIKINSLYLNNFPWSGKYFKGIPVTIEAIPDPGYFFSGWSYEETLNDINNPLFVDLVSDVMNLNATFLPDGIDNELEIITPAINENDIFQPIVFKYHNEDEIKTNNNPLIGDLYVNDILFQSAVILKKGVGTYLLNKENLTHPLSIKVSLNEEISHEIILNENSSLVDTIFSISDGDQIIWEANAYKFIDRDLTINGDLVIMEGVRVDLANHVNIIVHGSVTALGDNKNPIIFKSKEWDKPWGGFEFYNSQSSFDNCFFINAGGDPDKGWAHTDTQPIIFAKENSDISILSSYFLYSPGKGLGSIASKLKVDSTIIAFVFMGGEFQSSYLTFDNSYMLNIPNDDGIFVDADNDGFHIDNTNPFSDEPSKLRNSYFITGKDDAIDHYRSKLLIENCWIQDWMNEGVAASGRDTVFIKNTVSIGNQKGFEAGYGNPIMIIDHCLAMDNVYGFRLGDNYSTPNEGKMIIANSIAYNNEQNIKNYTNHLGGPLPNGIEVSFSITNEESYDNIETNVTGVPAFIDSTYRTHYSSIGASIGTNGKNIGIVDTLVLKYGPLIINEILYKPSSDYDSKDWVEFYNPSNDSIDISSWYLKDNDNDHIYDFPYSLVIPGKEFLVVSKDLDEFNLIYINDPRVIGSFSFGFGQGDQIRLYSSINSIVDSVQYGVNHPWPSSPSYSGQSIELINLNDNLLPENWMASTDIGGTPGFENSNAGLVVTSSPSTLPNEIQVFQNYPNPFNTSTIISFYLPVESDVSLSIFDIRGKNVKTIINKSKRSGKNSVLWNSTDDKNNLVSSGIYFFNLEAKNFNRTIKMTLIK